MARKIRGWNEGSIYQRPNGTWRAQVTVNGKRISYGGKTKAECQTWLRKMQFQLDQGFDHEGGKITLKEYMEEWLESYRVAIRPKTHFRYKDLAERYIIPTIGDTPIKDLNPLNIERCYAALLADGVGIRSVRLCHSVLHRALEKAVGYGVILHNPAARVTLPRYKPTEMRVWDASQVSVFLVAAECSHHKALYHLAIATGMRQGEIFGLKWSDLHWNSGTVQVQRQVQHVPHKGWSFMEPKSRAGRRTIKLGQGVLHALSLHREEQKNRIAAAGERWQDYDLIFPSSVGTPLNSSNLRRNFIRVMEKADLPRIRFHDLRHTAASLMLNHGIPTIVVSKILGHSKPSITMDIYGHLYHEMQGEAAKIMDDLVTPIKVNLEEVAFNKAKEPISR